MDDLPFAGPQVNLRFFRALYRKVGYTLHRSHNDGLQIAFSIVYHAERIRFAIAKQDPFAFVSTKGIITNVAEANTREV